MTYRDEFPDYPEGALPSLPEGFEDRSWHNDACPCFENAAGLEVFIDYPDPAMRECGADAPRFSLMRRLPDGDAETIVSHDEWAVILAAIASRS